MDMISLQVKTNFVNCKAGIGTTGLLVYSKAGINYSSTPDNTAQSSKSLQLKFASVFISNNWLHFFFLEISPTMLALFKLMRISDSSLPFGFAYGILCYHFSKTIPH